MDLGSTNKVIHLIYLGVLLIVVGVGFTFFKSKPKEKIVTVTETKIVYRDVIKEKKVFVDRTIVTRKADGDVITETIRDRSNITAETKTQVSSVASTKTVEKFMSSYSIDALYSIPRDSITSPSFNYKNVEINVGIRVFNLPVFALIGTEGTFNNLKLGLRVEL